jgi:hypothetical protein
MSITVNGRTLNVGDKLYGFEVDGLEPVEAKITKMGKVELTIVIDRLGTRISIESFTERGYLVYRGYPRAYYSTSPKAALEGILDDLKADEAHYAKRLAETAAKLRNARELQGRLINNSEEP